MGGDSLCLDQYRYVATTIIANDVRDFIVSYKGASTGEYGRRFSVMRWENWIFVQQGNYTVIRQEIYVD